MQSNYAEEPTSAATNAQPHTPATTEPAPPRITQQSLDALAKQKQIWLERGYPEKDIRRLNSNDESFIGLWESDRSGNPYGAVLIVHSEGQNADWPYIISTLRNDLPKHGWITLSIAVPDPGHERPPQRPLTEATPRATQPPSEQKMPNKDADSAAQEQQPPTSATTLPTPPQQTRSQQDESATDHATAPPAPTIHFESPKSVEMRAQARLKAAFTYLNQEGQYNIVIVAYGSSALRALELVANLSATSASSGNRPKTRANTKVKIQRPVRAIILVNARNQIPGSKQQLTALLAKASLPIMDIYFGNHQLDDIESQARKNAVVNPSTFIQIQVMVPSNDIFNGENRFTRRVRGFLATYAKGVEVR